MKRKIYASSKTLSIAEYLPADSKADYECWLDGGTQKGYNYIIKSDFAEFLKLKRSHRLYATVLLNGGNRILIGFIMLSPPPSSPDLAIRMLKEFRGKGYGATAFALATDYCVNRLGYDEIYAGCFETNEISEKMLLKCGYRPHPDGDLISSNVFTGEKIIQRDYVFRKPK